MIKKHRFPYNWTLKEAVFTKDKGTVFSCFACGGGSTMGYKLAGFDVLGCNEIDPKMIEAYKTNHNPKYAYLEPIQTFKLRTDLPDELYNLDILDGSPPCSSFSMAGNREKDWGKDKVFREGQAMQVLDTLFFDFIDLAKKLQPKVVVAENVKGLLQGEAKQYVRRIYKEFDEAGYYCQHWLLDASKMGVPQRRERVFFIALRKDLAEPFLVQQDMFTVNPELELNFNEPEIPFSEIFTDEERKPISEAIHEAYDYCIKNNVADFAQYYEVNFNKRKYFNTRLIFKDKVADTIKSDCTHVIENEMAYINSTELKLAGSYPLDYGFVGNKTDYLVGMSVPPVMTAQIATEIYNQWLSKL
jgi:DNA (cytosine-5)-methyltransferase 1